MKQKPVTAMYDSHYGFKTVAVGLSSIVREMELAGYVTGDVVVIVPEGEHSKLLKLAEAAYAQTE